MIYEYECKKCQHIIEVRQGILEDPKRLLYCAKCRRTRPVRRLISKTSFVLKGEAWEKDGYTRGKE